MGPFWVFLRSRGSSLAHAGAPGCSKPQRNGQRASLFKRRGSEDKGWDRGGHQGRELEFYPQWASSGSSADLWVTDRQAWSSVSTRLNGLGMASKYLAYIRLGSIAARLTSTTRDQMGCNMRNVGVCECARTE